MAAADNDFGLRLGAARRPPRFALAIQVPDEQNQAEGGEDDDKGHHAKDEVEFFVICFHIRFR